MTQEKQIVGLFRSSHEVRLIQEVARSINLPDWAWEDPKWLQAVALTTKLLPEPLEMNWKALRTIMSRMWVGEPGKPGLHEITLRNVNYLRALKERERRKAAGHWPGRKKSLRAGLSEKGTQ